MKVGILQYKNPHNKNKQLILAETSNKQQDYVEHYWKPYMKINKLIESHNIGSTVHTAWKINQI